MPSVVRVWGLPPEKKNQFCAKNYVILNKFWYFFSILQHKVGDYPPVLKVGDLSPPPSPTPMVKSVQVGSGHESKVQTRFHLRFTDICLICCSVVGC